MPNASTTTTRRANAGSFRKGDPRRHQCTPDCTHPRHRFTRDECVRGGVASFQLNAFELMPSRHGDDRGRTFLKWAFAQTGRRFGR